MLSLLWPRPARLVLGGHLAHALPMRLADLAGLERWATNRIGDAGASLWAALSIPDAPARRDELRRLYDLHERGGVGFGSPDVAAWLATHEGRAEQLRLSLRVRDRRTGRARRPPLARCLDMAANASDEEWFAWASVAWQAAPTDSIMRAIDAEIGVVWPAPRPRSGTPDPPADGWAASVWAVCKAAGWTFEQLGRLTLYQWDVARSDGKPRDVSLVEPSDYPDGIDPREFDVQVRAKRAAFFEEPGGSVTSPGPTPPA